MFSYKGKLEVQIAMLLNVTDCAMYSVSKKRFNSKESTLTISLGNQGSFEICQAFECKECKTKERTTCVHIYVNRIPHKQL